MKPETILKKVAKISEVSAQDLVQMTHSANASQADLVDEMIFAGRGNELPTETMQKAKSGSADDLTIRYVANLEVRKAIHQEREYRMRYHGSLRPINRSKF